MYKSLTCLDLMFSFEIRKYWISLHVLGWYDASSRQHGNTSSCLHPVSVSTGIRTNSVWPMLLLCWLNIINVPPLKFIQQTFIECLLCIRHRLCETLGYSGVVKQTWSVVFMHPTAQSYADQYSSHQTRVAIDCLKGGWSKLR